jgi:transposase InsO family protein
MAADYSSLLVFKRPCSAVSMTLTKGLRAPKQDHASLSIGPELTRILKAMSVAAVTARTTYPLTTRYPDRPFQQEAGDFASYGGKQFLILVDCKTDWPDIVEMIKDTTTPRLISALCDHFCRTAAPDLLWSDGGPQFTPISFANFLQTWGMKHAVSSPHHPQSNGKAESTVKSMKKLISAAWTGRSISWDTLSRALLQYWNTPCRKDGCSPAQKLFGHPVQDSLPAHRRSFTLEWQKSSQDA